MSAARAYVVFAEPLPSPFVRVVSRVMSFARRRPVVSVAAVLAVLAIGTLDVRLFVVPRSEPPARSDAFVVLGGDTFTIRLEAGVKLAREYPDSTLVVSTPGRTRCPRGLLPRNRLICFDPEPSTTQGEARAAAELALTHGWNSMTVVTTADQVWRARLRFSRCWDGDLRVVQAPTSVWIRIREVPYEMGATVKAEVFQRTC
jgi:uncharacterized SAM-binding protein YcdF (DUF218 family)